jgi:error-prone DNA polymerase
VCRLPRPTAKIHQQARKSGARAIIGAEVVAAEGFRYALLAESRQGYQNLCRLLTRIKLRTEHGDQERAVATVRDVAEHAAGLVCVTGGSKVPLTHGGAAQVEKLVQIFGGRNVFVELQRHYDCEEEHRNQTAIAIARKLQLPLLATNGVPGHMFREVLLVLTPALAWQEQKVILI